MPQQTLPKCFYEWNNNLKKHVKLSYTINIYNRQFPITYKQLPMEAFWYTIQWQINNSFMYSS